MNRFGAKRKSKEDEDDKDYDEEAPIIRNKVQDSFIKNIQNQMGLTVLKKGIIEHKANLKPEVYFAGQIVGGFNFNASE